MLRGIAVASFALLPEIALGQPVYLSCEFSSNGSPFVVNVAADEQNSTVSLYMPSTGNRQQLAATFTPDQVLFGDRMMSYILSRVDLSIVRDVPLLKSREAGRCTVAAAPKRAF